MPLLLEAAPDTRPAATNVRRRTVPFQIRDQGRRDDGSLLWVAGLASVAGNLNSYGEVFVPGAWVDTLAQKNDRKPLPMGLYHREAIGRWVEHADTADGLDLAGPISDTTAGRDAATLARDGVITGLSVGFWPTVYQFADPGERCTFQTPYGERSYEFDEYIVYIVRAELLEASLVIAPSDDEARFEVRSALAQARRALPALAGEHDQRGAPTWEDAAYSMALLMGGRGAAAFSELPDLEHRALFERVAAVYRQRGKTPPEYARHPTYRDVEFRHDEREVFHDRYLRKTIDQLCSGLSGVTGPLSERTREAADRAADALGAALDRSAPTLADIGEQIKQITRSLEGDTTCPK